MDTMSPKERHNECARNYYRENKERILAAIRQRRAADPEKLREYDRERYAADPEKKKKSTKAYYNANKEKCNETKNNWVKANPEARRAIVSRYEGNNPGRKSRYEKDRKAIDPIYAMIKRLRVRLNHAIRAINGKKADKTLELIGCSPRELYEHLEALFQPGMSWENRNLWHVDHKRPVSSFDLSSPDQQRECFHWSNLQPLWAEDNLKKGKT